MENILKFTWNLSDYSGLMQKIGLKHGINEIHFVFISNDEITIFKDLKFGCKIYDNGNLILDEVEPKLGFRYVQSDRMPLYTKILDVIADHNYIIDAWTENDGKKIYIEGNFIVDKPQKLYPSWIWNGNKWIAPVDQPKDGILKGIGYEWNEGLQQWVEMQRPKGID
jgi:hypothetical protein